MQIRWTSLAALDLRHIAREIRKANPTAAGRVARILYDGAMSLETFPNRGRPGRIAGTRELVFPPYIIVYRITAQTVEVLRIYHGAQDWP